MDIARPTSLIRQESSLSNQLACYFQSIGAEFAGYLVAKSGIGLKKPQAPMKMQSWIYDYGLFSKYSELSRLISIRERPIF